MTEQNTQPYDTDVLVVGAGPIGLTLACALGHHGVRYRIVEEKPKPKPYSRANNVWARGQELLAGIGLRDALAEKSYRVRQQTSLVNTRPLPPTEFERGAIRTPYPQVLYSGQDVIETTLSDAVAWHGATVERARKVVALAQDDDGVTATVVTPAEKEGEPDGPPERVRCRYLVGADGNEGTVRKAVGLDFPVHHFEGRVTQQVDAKLSWQRSTGTDQLWFFAYHNGFAGVLPVWGGYHRMFIIGDEADVPDKELTLEEIQALARKITGDETLTFTDPIWFSNYRLSHGVAEHFKRGRVFLAGDAGHHTMPIGGQGMNAGLHDAVCLGWRLAMAVAGRAEPAVLDSYDTERRGEHVRLGEQQTTGLKRLMYRNPVEDVALGTVAKLVPDLSARIFGSGDLQQLEVQYPDSPLNEDHLGVREALHGHLTGVPRAGQRAPDAEVTDGRGTASTLFSHLYNPDGRTWGWSLLAFDGRQDDAPPQLLAAVQAVAGWDFVRPRLVMASPKAPQINAGGATVLTDLDEAAHAAYGLDGVPALVLVRPDGHIAFRGPAGDAGLLAKYCERLFGAAGSAASSATAGGGAVMA